jgi:hypothetical protein
VAALPESSGQVREETRLSRGHAAKVRGVVERSKSIKTTKVAAEVLDWLIANVEEYVDGEATIYRIYFKPETFSTQTEAGRLQELYAGIPDVSTVEEACCLETLQKVTLCVKLAMDANVVRLEELFKRLIVSYVTSRAGGTDARMRFGCVIIHEFIFNIVSITVRQFSQDIRQSRQEEQRRRVNRRILRATSNKSILEQPLPPGFSIEMEVTWWGDNAAGGS